jgi:hypothetical protein
LLPAWQQQHMRRRAGERRWLLGCSRGRRGGTPPALPCCRYSARLRRSRAHAISLPLPPPDPPPHSNSEIYNHEALRESKLAGVDLHSRSDSAIVGYLYQKYGDTNELWNSLDGIFACIIWDERTGTFCAARDPIGICSLYWGHAADGSTWFASEMKALQTKCETIECFPPVRGEGEGGRGRAAAAARAKPRASSSSSSWRMRRAGQ